MRIILTIVLFSIWLLVFVYPALPQTPLSGTFVGVDLDKLGNTTLAPDGRPDNHIQILGVKALMIVKVNVSDNQTGVWETPANGKNWLVLVQQQGGVGTPVDIWFSQFTSTNSFTVMLTYNDGTQDRVTIGKPVISLDGTRVPPAPQISIASGAWSLGKPDVAVPASREILKNGVSLGTPRASQLALCNGDLYALSVRDGNWWKIVGTVWTHTIIIPCGQVDQRFTAIPLQPNQTLCGTSVLSRTPVNVDGVIWADTPDCAHVKGSTLFKVQSNGGVWCSDATDPPGMWFQVSLPCIRPIAVP